VGFGCTDKTKYFLISTQVEVVVEVEFELGNYVTSQIILIDGYKESVEKQIMENSISVGLASDQ